MSPNECLVPSLSGGIAYTFVSTTFPLLFSSLQHTFHPQSRRQHHQLHQQYPHHGHHTGILINMLLLSLLLFAPVVLSIPTSSSPDHGTTHQAEPRPFVDDGIRSFIPRYMFQYLANNDAAPMSARLIAARTLELEAQLREPSVSMSTRHPELCQEADNALVQQQQSGKMHGHTSVADCYAVAPLNPGTPKRPYRVLYDARNGKILPGVLLRNESHPVTLDEQATRVWDDLGKAFKFYQEVFGRNSINDHGMPIIGSIHFDRDVRLLSPPSIMTSC